MWPRVACKHISEKIISEKIDQLCEPGLPVNISEKIDHLYGPGLPVNISEKIYHIWPRVACKH